MALRSVLAVVGVVVEFGGILTLPSECVSLNRPGFED
jgi:hypothetical protein